MYVVSKGMELNETCADALIALSDAAREDGYRLYLKSAYRSYQTQNTMYYNRLKKNKGKDDGWVSKAGASDHQTGLGCDVIPRSWIKAAGMNSKMAKEPECQWMAEHCQEYGFIIRYPQGKHDDKKINLYRLAEVNGYTIAHGYEEAQNIQEDAKRMILVQATDDQGAKHGDNLPYAIDRKDGDLTLAQIVRTAIPFLDKRYSRFFMMV